MSNGVITTGSAPKALWPGINAWWGMKYDEHSLEYKDLFEIRSSTKAYEELVEYIGFGLAPKKNEGTATQYSTARQGTVTRFQNVPYSLGFIVTYEEGQDNQYEQVARERTGRLAFSFRTTKEIVGANIYNRAFDPAFTFGDGVSLINAAHPTDDGTQSNVLSTPADLSETAAEDMLIQIANAKDSAGLQIALMGRSLHVSTNDMFEACRIFDSPLQNDSANNAINAMMYKGMLPEGVKVNHYFDDPGAWFMRTNAEDGMIFFQREALTFSPDNDFDTKNMKYSGYERYVPGNADFRALYASPGG